MQILLEDGYTIEDYIKEIVALTRTLGITDNSKELKEVTALLNSTKKKSSDVETNTVVFDNGEIYTVLKHEGDLRSLHYIMPNIENVSVIADDLTARVVIVDFADGTSEKATISGDDSFSLEQGISICVTKKLLSKGTYGHGSSIYNKIIKHGLKVYNYAFENRMRKKNEEERIAAKKQKVAEKKAARKARREAEERERLVSIQAEAYLRAMREYGKESTDNVTP